MRKVLWMMSVSLDGFMQDAQGRIDWHMVDDELARHMNEELGPMGAFLDGRVTYELMAAYWPTIDADPSDRSPTAEFSRIWRAMPKIVYSKTLRRADWNATVVREVVPAQVEALKAQPGGDLMVGGGDLGAAFVRLDLIDEYRVYVHPILVGRGKPMLGPFDEKMSLRLVETRTFGNGVVLLRYHRSRG